MDTRLIRKTGSWDALRSGFAWPDIADLNIAELCVGRWAKQAPDRPALIQPREKADPRVLSFGDLDRLTDKFGVVLQAAGVQAGDRVAVLLPQAPETAIVHLAAYKIGAVVVPLFTLFGEDGLRYRLKDSGAKILVTDIANLPKIIAIRDDLGDLEDVFSIDGGEVRDFWAALNAARGRPHLVATGPETPALISYTSGTTGPPKGVLHGHRVLLGHLPGVETHHDFFPKSGDRMWTPADWAWMGGLCNVLLPALCHGVPVLAHRMGKFDPGAAYDLMRRHAVRNVFLPPTAIKYLRQVDPPKGFELRSVASGGEPLGGALLDWGRSAFGRVINEFYGATECNLVLGNSATMFDPKPDSTGRAVPGSEVAILDHNGQQVEPGTIGQIAVKRGDAAMFLGYWNKPDKTAEKFQGDWLLMGDEGQMDEEGYVFFSSRTDDVITSSGYRIGPFEIENCMMGHDDVALAAAIGEPDAERGEVVKAFVVLRQGEGSLALEAELIERVRSRISPHVAPKSVSFLESLPMTATGKIKRRELKGR